MASDFKLDLPIRPRRLRRTASLRAMVEETVLRPADFIAPLFVVDGKGRPDPIASMPGVNRLCIRDLVKECRELHAAGVPAVALFPKLDPRLKDDTGTQALNPDTLVLRAVRAVKDALPELTVITDVALDPYTSHGHDGVLNSVRDNVENDRTVGLLCQMALLQAEAGVDLVAPSDMMDGRVGSIKRRLKQAGLEHVAVMSYAAKFASCFYGPFREAAQSKPAFGDRRGYQLPPAARRLALRAVQRDLDEGADFVMVKPAGPYLDIIREVKNLSPVPVAAYQVSGEYAMLLHAARQGAFDLRAGVMESLAGLRRAGADVLITYFAPEVLAWLKS